MKGSIIFFISLVSSNAFLYPHQNTINICHSRKKRVDDDFYDEFMEYEVKTPSVKQLFIPKSANQKQYYEDICNDDIKIVIASGPAGTGKTLFPTQYAAKLLIETKQKIVLTRPLISVDEELGYLPGNINQKMDPWIIPLFDVLREFYTQKELNALIAEKRVEIVPLAFMRGRTFKNTYIIGDELQNTSNNQLLMLLTRLGENSKMVITGDVNQCDNNENGLMDLLTKINRNYSDKEMLREKEISLIEFTNDDIQRSAIIETILDIYAD